MKKKKPKTNSKSFVITVDTIISKTATEKISRVDSNWN